MQWLSRALRPGSRPRYSARAAGPSLLATALLAVLTARSGAQLQPPAPERVALAHVTVRESSASYRACEPLTFGVPIAAGALAEADAASLRVWRTGDGTLYPSQARALQFWPDGHVRWALVDTQVPLQARESLALAIGLAPDAPPQASPWRVRWNVEQGEASVDDGKTHWPILARSPQGDSVLGLAPHLVDRFGHGYHGVLDIASAEILESGPLRWTLRVHGVHRRDDEGGLPIAFHEFIARVHLLAGTSTARVEWTLCNGPLEDPPGPLGFRSYELQLDAGAGDAGVDLPSALFERHEAFSLQQLGTSAVQCKYTADGKALPVVKTTDLWGGVVSRVEGRELGQYVLRLDSAHNHPAALDWDAGGPLRIGLLPAQEQGFYWLDDAQQKTFRLLVARDVGREGRGLMQAAQRPAFPALEPVDVAASHAWGDEGLFYVCAPNELHEPPSMPKDPPTGWADWGEWNVKNTHAAGSPRNRLSVFLEAVQSGSADLFELARARAWHAMDLRPYHILGFSADKHPNANLYEGTPHVNEPPENRLGRSEMDAKFPEYKKGIPPEGHGYNGCESEHMTLDDIYEDWLLTGDWVAQESLAQAGEAMLTWHTVMPGYDLHSARSFGWTVRALIQAYRATRDRRFLDACTGMVARADESRGKGAVKYFRAGPPDARHIPDQASESSWMVAVAIHGLCAYWSETRDPLVPPMLHDLSLFCLSAHQGEDGFISDLPVNGPPTGAKAYQPSGTSQWIPGALAAAAFVTNDHQPVDRVYDYYTAMRTRTSSPLRFGSDGWHWWQPYLVSLQMRYGDAAVQNPAEFTRPGR
jgi:hypothetical protein